ncbi:L-arabonate dehydratase [Tsuneonella dongtanensis]|uniref:L-arabonate dehydratase n=1 Tax=Tsuneonella dongtanensis TaxID=692370 RepID=A0A1B2A989_9SPHN|nr:IlvD/Edd family dehydratase [Tsuneonella dongtanensis]ANY18644.1 L-arabonate dehydratase [Tsuneonella dongtanensis]
MAGRGEDRPRLRSRAWFDDPGRIDMTALYLERWMNQGITPDELRSGRPIIGIAQSGSDLSPCNRIHLDLVNRVRDGIRDSGGVPLVFPTHPIAENCRRPTAALDRNLAYMTLVELLHGYPFDGVVLTTGCDKTTPSAIMAASTVDIPAIVLSGGPMLDGWHDGELVGSGTVIWRSRRLLAAGEIDDETFISRATASAPSAGHCNTMGTASTMNAVAEALGLSLPGCAAIPAPYRERGQMAYATGSRIVEMVAEDLRPSRILSRSSFLNAIALVSACGGSTNAQPHINAMARHAGYKIKSEDWQKAWDVPLIVNMQPAGAYLGERFHRAGGVPAVLFELLRTNRIDGTALACTGKTIAEGLAGKESRDREMILTPEEPLATHGGFRVLTGNLFDFGIMKTSVISDRFRKSYLSQPGQEGIFEVRAIVFDGSDDYHERINDPTLQIDESCILVIRGAGPIGWPGSAEVVNLQPPDALIQKGIMSLPTLGDGRQSGTADSPSILNVSPESAAGGGLAWLRTGDTIRVDLNSGRCDALVAPEEICRRLSAGSPEIRESETPWQEMFRQTVGQMEDGAVMEFAVKYRGVGAKVPRHNH